MMFLGLLFAIAVGLVLYYSQKNFENQIELLSSKIDIVKEKEKHNFKKYDFFELIEFRDSYKYKCLQMQKKYGEKYMQYSDYQETCGKYRACRELAHEKFNEDKHGSWFEYFETDEL